MCSEHYGNISVLVYIQVTQRNKKLYEVGWFQSSDFNDNKKEFKDQYRRKTRFNQD